MASHRHDRRHWNNRRLIGVGAKRSVLDAAGGAEVRSIRVEGRDPAQTLIAAELTDRVVLSFTKRDTLKLAGVDLDRDRWVRDVSAVVVNP